MTSVLSLSWLSPVLAWLALFLGAFSCANEAGETPSEVEAPAVASSPAVPAVTPAATAAAATAEAPSAPDLFEGWQTYRVGAASFRYPPGWSVSANASGISLIPGDYRPNRELISVTATPARGITSPTAPAVGQALDGLMRSFMPGMRRGGQPKKVDGGHGRAGARFDWSGRAPDGRQARAAAWVVIEDGQSAGVSIVADADTLRLREDLLAQVLQSMGSGKGKASGAESASEQKAGPKNLDPRLIGMFTAESIHSGEGVYVNTRLVTALGADGIALYGAQSHMNASQKGTGGGFRWTATGSTDGSVQRGRWESSGKQLVIRWDEGGVSTYRYGFEPDGTLALRNAATGKLINIYRRVQ